MADDYQLPERYLMSDEKLKALLDRSFSKALGPEFRQANGAPPIWIQDSMEIIKDDFPQLFGKGDPQ